MTHPARITHSAIALTLSALLAGCAKPDTVRAPDAATSQTTVDAAAVVSVAAPASDAPSPGNTAPTDIAPQAASATAIDKTQAVTDAEADYAAIYGPENAAAQSGTLAHRDPWERYNRRVHAFNNKVDQRIAKPLAQTYIRVVPRPVRARVTNFFNNLSQPLTAVNALLQGRPSQAWDALGRFFINSTVGVLGLHDVATRDQVPNTSEDFGQTLGVWGWKHSRYFELPFLGPRTVRDAIGFVAESRVSPLQQMHDVPARVFLQGLQLVDMRTQLMAADSMREGAVDEYTLYRDAWMQRRQHQIFGDRDALLQLPDYLDDIEPQVEPKHPAR